MTWILAGTDLGPPGGGPGPPLGQPGRDGLTGLPNRAALVEELQALIRNGLPFALAVIDLDLFINLDQKLGRAGGDGILSRVGAFFRAEQTAGARAFRYGGDEFALLYPGMGPDEGLVRAEDLRRRFRRARFVRDAAGELIPIPMTFSAGVSGFPAHGKTVFALLRAGETALALAKKLGRNRAEPAPDAADGRPEDQGQPAPQHQAVGPYDRAVIYTVMGGGLRGYWGDGGPARDAGVCEPYGVAVDTVEPGWFLVDRGNHAIRRIDASGRVTTVAGDGEYGYSGDGGPAARARLHKPNGVAVDGRGNLFIADTGNHCIRRVDRTTGIITTVAGCGRPGYTGDGGPATQAAMSKPSGVAVDAAGNIYTNEYGNNVIRRVSPEGIISTLAGTGEYGYSGDGGPATQARFNKVYGVAVDPAGNVYVADYANHAIRRISAADGTISTAAGSGECGYSGDGGPAAWSRLRAPFWVTFDRWGAMYICDTENHRLRRVDPEAGVIATVAGCGRPGYWGDGGPARQAALNLPAGAAAGPDGEIYIADYGNNSIRCVRVR
ncbi:MAG: diguanylate cyclase [Acetobacteraceae bacterium]|nr:diguanylate cyclase [Acetobacteraceae bacterium]